VPSIEKYVTVVKNGKTHVGQVTIGLVLAVDWLKKKSLKPANQLSSKRIDLHIAFHSQLETTLAQRSLKRKRYYLPNVN